MNDTGKEPSRTEYDGVMLDRESFDTDNVHTDPMVDIDELSMSEQKRMRYEQDTHFRKHFANWVMIVIPAWLLFVILILAGCGSGLLYIDSTVLVTLLTTTTVNVLGLAYIVLKDIFHNRR